MIILTHSLAGAALATGVNSPMVAFFLGFIFHFILDAIPHFDQGTIVNPSGEKIKSWPGWVYWTIALDVIITFFFFWAFLKNRPDFQIMIWGGLGGVSVDVIENFPIKAVRDLPILKQIEWLHHKIHYWLPKEKWYIGLISEIIVTGGIIWYLLKF